MLQNFCKNFKKRLKEKSGQGIQYNREMLLGKMSTGKKSASPDLCGGGGVEVGAPLEW